MLEYAAHGSPYDCAFIHGAGGNGLLWSRCLQYFSGTSRAFALNLPGHPSGEIACHTIRDYSEVVHEFISERDFGRIAVCGHSMGSAIALDLAIEHPDDVAGLILIGAGAKLGVDADILSQLAERPLKAIEQIITPMSFHAVDLDLGREARAALSISNLPVFLNDYLACNGFDVRDKLSKITAKTLIICGEGDRMTPPRWSQYLHANIVGSEIHLVKEAGHMVPLEKPRHCADIILPFLSALNR